VKEGSDGKHYWKLLWFIRYICEWFECQWELWNKCLFIWPKMGKVETFCWVC
jgi:hypothetical protein